MTLLRIRAMWRRWIEVLALAHFAWRESRRARQSLVVACEGGRFVVRKSLQNRAADPHGPPETPQEDVVSVLAPGAPPPPEVMHAARSSFVVLELPADMVVVRRIAVPVRARGFVAGIVRNQIERLSPWHADQVVHGFDAGMNAEDPANMDVRVFIALRSVVDQARDELAALGLPVDRIVAPERPPSPLRDAEEEGGVETVEPAVLWSRLADISPETLAGPCRRLSMGISAVVAVSLALGLWAATSAASLGRKSEEVAARVTALRRQIHGPASQSALNPRERAWYAKETSPTVAILVEALSRALPDSAYLTELRLENSTVRLIGLTDDAPSLVAPLEHSGHLSNVHFFAPTTRGPDGAHFRFNIEAHVEPHFRLAEEER